MSTTKFEHVIGLDGLHRIRKTCVENGEIIGNSHKGFSSRDEAEASEIRNLSAALQAACLPWPVAEGIASCYAESFRDILTVDERVQAHHEEFNDCRDGKPADPFEPQTEN